MNDYKLLLLANKAWAEQLREERPDYFTRQAEAQQPNFLWIGCSDSRVAPDQITNSPPGVMSIHRNVANLVYEEDRNLMAVLETAVERTRVRHIILCGHYGCGGVAQGWKREGTGAVGEWVAGVHDVYTEHAEEVDALPEGQRLNRMVELNVRDQLVRLARVPLVQAAFERGQELTLHGWVYDLRDGILKPLMTIDAGTRLDAVERPEPVLV
ncbi:carbonic anhydrase [Sphingomonas spermidinifaciens]|uniref:carbonic anhydrase n=1 Tax=Sphingomonas spermidinifaciens TaxID=1141889 RepID=A0A2A4B3Q9_9SPHN|nr:carbonic anhydrase [Sphingomonas spermidinifaciens]PCD02286.1 carbonic anhydrase [Sphingomonas spermidinifaciens]